MTTETETRFKIGPDDQINDADEADMALAEISILNAQRDSFAHAAIEEMRKVEKVAKEKIKGSELQIEVITHKLKSWFDANKKVLVKGTKLSVTLPCGPVGYRRDVDSYEYPDAEEFCEKASKLPTRFKEVTAEILNGLIDVTTKSVTTYKIVKANVKKLFGFKQGKEITAFLGVSRDKGQTNFFAQKDATVKLKALTKISKAIPRVEEVK